MSCPAWVSVLPLAYPHERASWGDLEQDLAPSKYIINRMMVTTVVMLVMPLIADVIFSLMGDRSRDSHP